MFLLYLHGNIPLISTLTFAWFCCSQGTASNIDAQAVCAFMKSSTENMRTALNEVLLMSKQDVDMRLELKWVNIHRLIEKVHLLIPE